MTNKDLEDMKNKNLEEEIINGYPNARKHFDSFVERQPKPRTIDDLECGDYVLDERKNKRRCLGRCGEIAYMSSYYDFYCFGGFDTIQYYKKQGYTLYQESQPTDDTIEIEGKKYSVKEIKEKLK